MDWAIILNHSLVYGLILSAALSVLILVSLKINPEMWLQDYPPDVKAAWGPMSDKARRQRAIFVIPFFGAITGTLILATMRLGDALGGTPPFPAVFATAAIIAAIFNFVDAVIIDWLILTVLWPSLGVLPGTEGMAGYRDMRLQAVNFLKGFVFAAAAGLLTAGIAALVGWIGSVV
jgi:hypothetical protein